MTTATKPTIHFTEVALRDGHQSLIATRLRTEDMLPICDKLDQAGFWSLEVWGGATFDSCIRFLKEDPWERLRTLRKALPNSRLQMLLRGQNLLGYRHYADDVVTAFVEKSAENGMDVFRIFDALNDPRNLKTAVAATLKVGKHAQGTLCYTTSPVHSVDTFVELGKQLEDMGCSSIAIKDMAGLLTPSVAGELVSQLKQHVKLPLFLHSHATSGMAAMCQLKAVEAGCDHIDTAISAFAGGTSHPPTETMAVALKDAGYDVQLNMALIKDIADHLKLVRKKYAQFESAYAGVDTDVLISQVPGGMMSNLANQLRDQGALDRIGEIFAEIPRVRKDLGFPPLVTPSSQIVGTQAVVNVLAGERYKTITNEVKRYLQGGYGKPPAPVNTALRTQAIGNEELIDVRPADLIQPEMNKLTKESQGFAHCPEDVLTYALFPDIGKTFLEERAAGTLQPEALTPAISEAKSPADTHSSKFKITLHGESYDIEISGIGPKGQPQRRLYLTVDGIPEEVLLQSLDDTPNDSNSGRPITIGPGDISAAISGVVVQVCVAEGDIVSVDDSLIVIEAMKMETDLKAPIAGKVTGVYVKKGDRVSQKEVLIKIEERD